jgi:hypothetical protein
MDFKELTMQFQQYKFHGITVGSLEIICSHCIKNLLKKDHSSIISQLHSIQAVETPLVHPDLQAIISHHSTIFQNPQGLPPSREDHDHSFPLILGSLPPNVLHYHHPFAQKNEIEKIVRNVLFIPVPTLILPLLSWSSRNKELGACVLIFVPLTNLPSRKNFTFLS